MSAENTLSKYLPQNSWPLLAQLLKNQSVKIKITKARNTKFGDYRPLRGERWKHQITLNHDLNLYAFLITFVHEIAHLYVFEKYQGKVRPHGDEWQQTYVQMLKPFVDANLFPQDITIALNLHLSRPTASSCTDLKLFAVIKTYDDKPDHIITVENLEPGGHFLYRNGNIYRKVAKLRKRYQCIEIKTKKTWFFHAMAEVERLDI